MASEHYEQTADTRFSSVLESHGVDEDGELYPDQDEDAVIVLIGSQIDDHMEDDPDPVNITHLFRAFYELSSCARGVKARIGPP
jgi:hypothetical protein